MASGEGSEKKISFGFSKSIKKPVLNKNPPQEKKVDYIECLDDKSIKVVGGEEEKDEPLVIPMLGSKTWHDRILNKVNADIFEPKVEPVTNGNVDDIQIKQELVDDANENTVVPRNDVEPMEMVFVKEEILDQPMNTLEEQAAAEILKDLQHEKDKTDETKISAVPLPADDSLAGKQESTLEDYEQIPIDKFGEAMLRGMGWKPGQGIGKNQKIIAAVIPELRPRGMGLGADKITIQKQIEASKLSEEGNLKLVKGAYVRIITGKQSGNYGQIEGVDDEGGRLMIKLALGGNIISINESLVRPVSKSYFDKNAKVLNSKKYDEYTNKGKESSVAEVKVHSDSSEEENKKLSKSRYDKSRERKKSKKHKRHSSEDDSDSDRRSRKKRNSSDSDFDQKRKKSKKTKKSKIRDSSSERSNHKSKRKHKERDRDSPKRDKYRQRRSRSRSPRRR